MMGMGMFGMMHDYSGGALSLIALGLGYLVCVKASGLGKGRLRLLGYIIGAIIIISSLVMLIGKAGKVIGFRHCYQKPSYMRGNLDWQQDLMQLPPMDLMQKEGSE